MGGRNEGWEIHDDPFSVQRNERRSVGSIGAVEQEVFKLWKKITDLRKSEGRAPYDVVVIHRDKPDIHRYFNVRLDVRDLEGFGKHQLPSDYGAAGAYQGAANLLEQILFGDWRVATPTEEKACREKDVVDAIKKEREAEDKNKKRMLSLIGSVK